MTPSPSPSAAERLRVLLVEDSQGDAGLIQLHLRKVAESSYEVCHVVRLAQALAELRARRFDVVLLDLSLPDDHGLDTLRAVRREEASTPVVVVTGAEDEDLARTCLRHGAQDYVTKAELSPMLLRRVIGYALSRQREAAVQAAEHRLRLLLEQMPVVLWATDPDLRLTAVTRGRTQLIDVEPGAAPSPLGEVFGESWPGSPLERAHRDALAGREGHCELTWDGRTYDIVVRSQETTAESPEPGGLVGIAFDMTEHASVREQLRQAQKMEAIGRLAGGVAHDFNNLLTAITSFGHFVMEALETDESRRDMEEVLRAAKSAKALTSQLLAFSRKGSVSPTEVDLNGLVRSLERMLDRLLGDDVEVRTILASDLHRAWIDAGAFEQVLVNLAVNARDAMPEGGRLTIETRNVAAAAVPHLGEIDDAPSGDCVLIAVTDDGAGIPPEVVGHIFEPFFTTKERGKGTGLGLSTCYGIVRQAGGQITVYSEPGHGTTVRILLPRAGAGAASSVEGSGLEHAPGGSEVVLIAEDEELVRRVAVRSLERLGYKVLAAANARDAVMLWDRARKERPVDLLLTDVVMPGMGGPELAARLCGQQPGLKVLFMSGYPGGAAEHQGLLDSGSALLCKPFTPLSLAKSVRETLGAAR